MGTVTGMNDAQQRILTLPFDHDVFRLWPTGPWMSIENVVFDDAILAATVERLDRHEVTPVELSREQHEELTLMVRNCCERARARKKK